MATYRKLDCPNCHRPVRPADMRCRVCRHKLICWYVIITILAITGLAGCIQLLEAIA